MLSIAKISKMKNWILTIAIPIFMLQEGKKENYLIVGTYTGGKSEGIYVYKFNSDDGSYKEVSHVKASNPSFVVVSPDEKFVYSVHENGKNNGGGEISSFSFNKETGTLTFLNKQTTDGDHPCYTEIDKTGKWVFAGNYSSGSLSVFPVNADGSLGAASTHITHTGSGKIKGRQDNPHVHCTKISPDNRWLYVPDLGIDKVMIYAFDEKTGKLTPGTPASCCLRAWCRSPSYHISSQWKICLRNRRTFGTCKCLSIYKWQIKIFTTNKHFASW